MRRDEQPSNRAPRLLACAATFASVLAGPGCVGSDRRASSIDERVEFVDDAAMTVHPEEYAAVFERARGALRDAGFSIERVDAAAGVISTAPLPGLAAWKSPLLRGADATGADAWHASTIEARAVFLPGDDAADLRRSATPMTLRFEVVERREHRPSRRLDPTSVLYAAEFSDRSHAKQGLEPSFTVATARNHRAEVLLLREVARFPRNE